MLEILLYIIVYNHMYSIRYNAIIYIYNIVYYNIIVILLTQHDMAWHRHGNGHGMGMGMSMGLACHGMAIILYNSKYI